MVHLEKQPFTISWRNNQHNTNRHDKEIIPYFINRVHHVVVAVCFNAFASREE